tara:strand:+ start:416 stop:586 length:171 start_codon:yes stop_codon:yes gene_type:complete
MELLTIVNKLKIVGNKVTNTIVKNNELNFMFFVLKMIRQIKVSIELPIHESGIFET